MALVVGALGPFAQRANAAWPPPSEATRDDVQSPEGWPNDPLYGYGSHSSLDGWDGQWEFYSFIPERSVSVPPAPTQDVASGVSVDLAWRHTIGDPRVLIAMAGPGLLWDDTDLHEPIELNIGELRASPPVRADQSDCDPLDPSDSSRDLFDCNGDGRLTVADYAEHPALEPADTNPRGDTNGNGVFDPQDLLRQSFVANATDDDANGYIDDIVGWDFVDGDSDPFDEEGRGDGTAEALAAVATTNNEVGGAGACPRCRLLPLRVGRTASVDPRSLALATVYATDRGARLLGVNGETQALTPLLRSALAYAHEAGVLVVAKHGNTPSRRPAFPASLPDVLAVGAVSLGGKEATSTSASSFLAFSPCSGYGAALDVAVPARDCPANVVGLTVGVAGLATTLGLDFPSGALTPDELRQLLTTTADDVDILESRDEASTLAWSQSGFDQRFGYGRLNADRATDRVVRGIVPPTIHLASPQSSVPLYAGQVTGPVSISGTIDASRADSCDYWVEWAPGVQPPESAFEVLVEEQGMSGEEAILAELDIRSIDVTHDPDVDSALGENAGTITLRVRATAHFRDPPEEASSELRRTITVQEDASVVEGFPLQIGATIVGGPKLADIDGDGTQDVVVAATDGAVHVWSLASGQPVSMSGFPYWVPATSELPGQGFSSSGGVDPELDRDPFVAAPGIGDLDGDGDLEIVATTRTGTVIVLDNQGHLFPGWPQSLPDVQLCAAENEDEDCVPPETGLARGAVASPVLEDLDGDGELEIVQAGLDGSIHAFENGGEKVDGWPLRVETSEGVQHPLVVPPAVALLDEDSYPDWVTPAGGEGDTAEFVAFRGLAHTDAVPFSSWPVEVVNWPLLPDIAGRSPGAAAIADFDNDGRAEIVLHGNVSAPFIVPYNPGPQASASEPPANALPVRDATTGARGIEFTGRFGAQSAANDELPMFPMLSRPSLGDLDQDGYVDVVTVGASRDIAEQIATSTHLTGPEEYLLAFWSGKSGTMFPGSPEVIAGSPWYSDAAIADISGDGYPEVIVGTDGHLVHAVDACGRTPEGWPKATGQWASSAPAVGDLDGDDQLEVVVTTRQGWIFAWHTSGSSDGTIAWASQHHDNRNTSSLGTPLDEGAQLTAPRPLYVSANGECIEPGGVVESDAPPRLVPSGGCGCQLGRPRLRGGGLLGMLPLLAVLRLAALGRRRRSARSRGKSRRD